MTLPFNPAVVQSVVNASTALAEWKRAMDSLAVEVSRLASLAAGSGDRAGLARLASNVESLLSVASRAAAAVGASGAIVPADVQQRWVSILTRMQAAMQAARSVSGANVPQALPPVVVTEDVPDPRAGLRIPGTSIVVPWLAVVGVALVVGVGLYVSRRRKR